MAKFFDIDTDVRINGTLSSTAITEGGTLLSAKYLGINSDAKTASKWKTGMKLTLSGDATGNITFDGSTDVILDIEVTDNSHSHTTANVTGLDTALSGKLDKTGGTMTGDITFSDDVEGIIWSRNTDGAYIKFKNTGDSDTDSYLHFNVNDNGNEYFKWSISSGATPTDVMTIKTTSGNLWVKGSVTASSFSGNASTATKLATARTISLTGDVTGSGSFDGSGNLSITTAVGNYTHNHDTVYLPLHGKADDSELLDGIDSTGFARAGARTDNYVWVRRNGGGNSAMYITQQDATSHIVEFYQGAGDGTIKSYIDNSGNFSGNSATATKLATSRTISLTGDVSGTGSFDGSGNLSISTTVGNYTHNHDTVYLPINGKADDSELLDGLDSTQFVRSDVATIRFSDGNAFTILQDGGTWHQKIATLDTTDLSVHRFEFSENQGGTTFTRLFSVDGNGDIYAKDRKVYHTGNFDPSTKLNLSGGTMTGILTMGANNIVGSSTNVYLNLGSSPVLSTVSNITIHADSDNSSTTEYVSIKAGTDDLRVISNGTMTFNSNLVYHAGNLSPLTTGVNQSTGGGFTVKGTAYIGDSSATGELIVKGASNVATIHLDGDSSGKVDSTNVKSYIAGNGNADFKGTVTIQTLAVNTSTLVSNLNSQYLNGLEEIKFAKNESIADVSGYGVQTGLGATAQSVPNMTVKIGAGTVYTNTGRRMTIVDTNITVSASSTSYDRNDIIYVQGSSGGANEGKLAIATGTPSATPVDPSVPSDAVKIARVRVPKNIGSITDGTSGTTDLIDDIRAWKNVYLTSSGYLYAKELTPDTYGSNGTSAVFDVGIKSSSMAKSVTIAKGSTSATWTHNLPFGTNYAVQLSCNSPEPHVYWSSKTATAITVNLDDVCEDDVVVDILIVGY